MGDGGCWGSGFSCLFDTVLTSTTDDAVRLNMYVASSEAKRNEARQV
jgi:hypothetical protein